MPLITLQEASAWGEKSKLAPALVELDLDLLAQIEVEVLGRIAAVADTATWVDSSSAPSLVKTIIAKYYVAWLIDRQYSEDEELSAYATLLRTSALRLQEAILSSEIDIPGATVNSDGLPSIWPIDDDPYFTMAEGPAR